MGASGWSYFVPFQLDVNVALLALRWDVFRSDDYSMPPTGPIPKFEDFAPPDPAIWEDAEELASWRAMYDEEVRRLSGPRPDSPDALAKHAGTEGTHSIIDIPRVSETGGLEVSGPLPRHELMRLFGTERPTKAMVLEKVSRMQEVRGRWLCTYVVVYEANAPKELCFAGHSGD